MKTKCYTVTVLAFMMVLLIHYCYSQKIVCLTPEKSINFEAENAFNKYVVKFKAQGKHLNTDLKIIPVIIHVIYRNTADSLQMSMARIKGQIDATNKQMRRLNANAKETRKIFLPVAADCNIQVCLATKRPDRSSFNGVIYHKYPHFDLMRDFRTVRAATILEPDKYLNVWVISGRDEGGAVAPWDRTATRDGFWVGSENFGTMGADLIPFMNGGVTFTHEIGHYLGVDHTFHNATGYPGQCELAHDGSIGDLCADTPLDFNPFSAISDICDGGIRDCVTPHEGKLVTQSENYMYYNPDSCRNMFSKDQRARMRACLFRLRHKLTLPSNLKITGVNCKDLRGDCNSCGMPVASTEDYNDLQVAKPVLEKKIIMFPNPANGIVHINYGDLTIKKDMSIRIYNGVGQMLKEIHSHTTINELNVGSFADGVYYIKITVDNSSVTKYIMKTGSGKVMDK